MTPILFAARHASPRGRDDSGEIRGHMQLVERRLPIPTARGSPWGVLADEMVPEDLGDLRRPYRPKYGRLTGLGSMEAVQQATTEISMSTRTTTASPAPKRRRVSPLTVGIRFENEVRRRLVAAGWYAARVAGSKTPADIVALPPMSAPAGWKGTVLIQCKGHQRNLPRREVAALLDLADRHAGIDVVHCHPADEPGQIVLVNLIGGREYELPAAPDDGRALQLVGDAGGQ